VKTVEAALDSRGTDIVDTTPRLQSLRDQYAGKMPGGRSFEEHVAIASDELPKHRANYGRFIADMRKLSLPGTRVEGRVKTLESIVAKLHDKPHYKSAADLQDLTGVRLVVDTTEEVMRTAERVKARYQVLSDDDYIETPRAGYRAYHLAIKDTDGLVKEVQILTNNQLKLANWRHDVYKPRTLAQKELLRRNRDTIDSYVVQLSDYYAALDDNAAVGKKPELPAVVRLAIGGL